MRRIVLLAGALLVLAAPVGAQEPASSPTPSPSPADQPASVTVPEVPTEADPEGAADLPSPSASEIDAGEPVDDQTQVEQTPVPPIAADTGSTASDRHRVPLEVESGNPEALPAAQAAIEEQERSSGLGLVDSLLGDGTRPPFPMSHYQIGTDLRAFDAGEAVMFLLMSVVHQMGVWTVAAMSWVLGFVLRFDLGHLLAGDAGRIADGYAEALREGSLQVIGRTALLIAIAHAGWQTMRSRGPAAAADVLVALLIAAVGTFAMINAERAGCAGLQVMSATTVAMLELSQPEGPTDVAPYDFCDDGDQPEAGSYSQHQTFDDSVRTTFLHEPFLLLQYGQVPAVGTPCRTVADELLRVGPWGEDDFPREQLEAVGCPSMAAFNADIGADRVVGAAVWTAGTTAFAIAVVLTAATLMVAQVAGTALVAAMPFAMVLGVSPGAGRQVLARWVHAVLKVGVMFVGSGFFLALMMAAVSAIQGATEPRGLVTRLLSSVVVAWALVILRGKVFGSMRRAAATTAQGLAPGHDVGGPGRGPGAWAAGKAVDAAYTGLVLHQGAVGAAAGAALSRRGAAAASSRAGAGLAATGARAGQGIAALGRVARLRRSGTP